MDKTQIVTMSPLVLAYLGDTVYESYIREYLIRGNCNKKRIIKWDYKILWVFKR